MGVLSEHKEGNQASESLERMGFAQIQTAISYAATKYSNSGCSILPEQR